MRTPDCKSNFVQIFAQLKREKQRTIDHVRVRKEIMALEESNSTVRFWLLFTNATMMIAWARVLRVIFRKFDSVRDIDQDVCLQDMTPDLLLALAASFLELANAFIGVTRSKPSQVLLFSAVRYGTELLISPMLPSCSDWQHILTVFCWSVGDTIRFGCFVLDTMVPGGRLAKSVRYTVGPLIFPFGAASEMLMVISAASRGRPILYLVAALWPLGFYPLMKQLLRQRKKFFNVQYGQKEKEIKSV